VLALINSSGALGAFAGAWLVGLLQARTGNSRAGFLLMSGSLIASGLLMLCLPSGSITNSHRGAAQEAKSG
jgi:MFS-type transporter involved in bile tolerance (Atg22 family)